MMAKPKPAKDLAYEEAFRELEAIVEELEAGELTLEESLERFERGQELTERCSQLLQAAELRLEQLVPENTGGEDAAEPGG